METAQYISKTEHITSRTGEFDMPQFAIEVHEPIGKGNGVLHSEGIADTEHFTSKLSQHMVRIDGTAASCCIDGRACSGCMDGSSAEIGPKVAGAAVVTSYAAIELIGGWYDTVTEHKSPAERMEAVAKHLLANGIKLRAHCDSSAKESKFLKDDTGTRTGCGANDNAPTILQIIQTDKDSVHEIAKSLLGDAFSAENAKYRSAEELANRHVGWQPIDMLQLVSTHAGTGEVEVLEGLHNEVAVVFNYNEGYTLDRDAFVKDTGMQVFVIDMWYIEKLANALASGPNAESQYERLRHAMVDFQVGTYLTLCDGSHPAVTLT